MAMEITEEVDRRRQTLAVEDPQSVYPEIKDLLERRMSFDEVKEEKYYHDIEEGNIRSRLRTVEGYDRHTREEIEIFLVINENSRELDIQLKVKMVTAYPDDFGYQRTLWYYAYRALYDKFLYGVVRHGYEHAMEEKADELLTRIRQNVEA